MTEEWKSVKDFEGFYEVSHSAYGYKWQYVT